MSKLEPIEWINPAQPGALKYTSISGPDVIGEYAINFIANGRSYLSFVLPEHLDFERKLLRVGVAGVFKNGWYLLSLPRETLTTSTFLRIHKDDPELLYDPQ